MAHTLPRPGHNSPNGIIPEELVIPAAPLRTPNGRIATIANAIKPLDNQRLYDESDIAVILMAVKLAKAQETKQYDDVR